jgi:hypothetical protein
MAIKRDKVYKILKINTPDGQGGFTSSLEDAGSYMCQVSYGDNPLEADEYGVKAEQILKIISNVSFSGNEDAPIPSGISGFSPTIEVKTENEDEYVLHITDKDNEYDTPNLKGAAGAQGEKGEPGEKGETGPQGEQGPQGEKGEKGDKGDQGETGPQGEKGEQGERGPRGAQGETGAQGPQGIAGSQGPRGFKGDQGEKGEKGDTGEQGPKGDKGDKGDKGEKGDKGDAFTYDDLTPEQKAELSGDWEDLNNKPFTAIDNETLIVTNGVLKVNTTDAAEQDNTRPITSSGVHVILGDIETILEAI